jgi:hypothetical protein
MGDTNMSVAAIEKDRISVEDYLAGERDGEVRHEYVAGQVYAMTGASRRQGLINGALFAALRPGARQRDCQLFTNDMKVYVHHAGDDAFASSSYTETEQQARFSRIRGGFPGKPSCMLVLEHLQEAAKRTQVVGEPAVQLLRELLVIRVRGPIAVFKHC